MLLRKEEWNMENNKKIKFEKVQLQENNDEKFEIKMVFNEKENSFCNINGELEIFNIYSIYKKSNYSIEIFNKENIILNDNIDNENKKLIMEFFIRLKESLKTNKETSKTDNIDNNQKSNQ